MRNILLVIVDALRLDYVAENRMPWLYRWGEEHTSFTQHHATSHCTDPCVTQILSGKHPDELRLYSMMFGSNYTVPEDVVMLSQTAQKHGFTTCTISNLLRWYARGVDRMKDCRGWSGQKIFNEAIKQVAEMPEPWFMVVHTDDMHTNYTGGSYQNAAMAVDCYIRALIEAVDEENTWIAVTSDHGEGLNQSGQDGRPIQQHGEGLWDFLTHVPLLTNIDMKLRWICTTTSNSSIDETVKYPKWEFLFDHGGLHSLLRYCIDGTEPLDIYRRSVFQAGATPRFFHRGVVFPDGRQFIRESERGKPHNRYYVGEFTDEEESRAEMLLAGHCALHGIDYWEGDEEGKAMIALKGLGYFE